MEDEPKVLLITREQIESLRCECATSETNGVILNDVCKHEVVVIPCDGGDGNPLVVEALARCRDMLNRIRNEYGGSCWIHDLNGSMGVCAKCKTFLVGDRVHDGCPISQVISLIKSAENKNVAVRTLTYWRNQV